MTRTTELSPVTLWRALIEEAVEILRATMTGWESPAQLRDLRNRALNLS